MRHLCGRVWVPMSHRDCLYHRVTFALKLLFGRAEGSIEHVDAGQGGNGYEILEIHRGRYPLCMERLRKVLFCHVLFRNNTVLIRDENFVEGILDARMNFSRHNVIDSCNNC
jgi:hypothetical protein